jgi:hypothetical protein
LNFFSRKKLGLIQEKKISEKIGFSKFKVRHSGYRTDPPQNQILMGVVAFAFFDLRASRGPQGLLESAI